MYNLRRNNIKMYGTLLKNQLATIVISERAQHKLYLDSYSNCRITILVVQGLNKYGKLK